MDTTYRIHAHVPATVHVCGAFRPNGSSAISDSESTNTGYAAGIRVARNSAGNFTVTLPFGAKSIRGIRVSYRLSALPASVASICVFGEPSVSASAISFVIQFALNNVAAEIASNVANWIDWALDLDNETLP
jgi:hypothetical protein